MVISLEEYQQKKLRQELKVAIKTLLFNAGISIKKED
jgi:hypothetical protein